MFAALGWRVANESSGQWTSYLHCRRSTPESLLIPTEWCGALQRKTAAVTAFLRPHSQNYAIIRQISPNPDKDRTNLGLPQQVASKYAGKRLLIVDDDADMRLLLAEYFRRLGFQVEEHEDGAAALEPATIGRFDCFIFDVSMPGMTGFELLKRVRDRGVQTPALFLTAHDALDYKVAGYESGGDDYLAKPFSPRELEFRVEALLRRTSTLPPERDTERVEVGGLVIDKRRHEVIRQGVRIDLTPLEFQILELLASEPGRAWSRNALLDRVWSTEYEGYQRNIDPHINRLRKKLETDPKNPRYVLTVRGVGYKLNEAP
jgi:two-component system alkaline phosphatase synthesis response regulator PhoP